MEINFCVRVRVASFAAGRVTSALTHRNEKPHAHFNVIVRKQKSCDGAERGSGWP
jgi:hypothetical protein